jgi:hypothetical protein
MLGLILPDDHLIVSLPSSRSQVTLLDYDTDSLPLIV